MFSLQQLTVIPLRLNVADQTWQLTPLMLGDIGELERAVPLRDHSNRAPSLQQLERWIHTRAGTAYVLWLALRPRHSRLSLSAAQTVLEIAADLPPRGNDEPDDPSLQSTDTEAPACWAELFRYLARRYGWTPQQIAALTVAQAQTLVGETPIAPGRAVFSRQEYRDWRSTRKAQVAAAPSNDAPTSIAKRLALFRNRLPDIFAPLSAATLRKLTDVAPRLMRRPGPRRSFRTPVRRRWTNTVRPQIHHDVQLTPQINWHLHALIVALRNTAPPSDVLPISESSSPRIARFQ